MSKKKQLPNVIWSMPYTCNCWIISRCSNDCRLVDNAAEKCLALCIDKEFTNGDCGDTDHLCHCYNE